MNIGLSDIIGFGAQASSSPSAMMGAAAARSRMLAGRRRPWTPKRTYAALKIGNPKSKAAAKAHLLKVTNSAKAGSPIAKVWMAKFNAICKANPKIAPRREPRVSTAGYQPTTPGGQVLRRLDGQPLKGNILAHRAPGLSKEEIRARAAESAAKNPMEFRNELEDILRKFLAVLTGMDPQMTRNEAQAKKLSARIFASATSRAIAKQYPLVTLKEIQLLAKAIVA